MKIPKFLLLLLVSLTGFSTMQQAKAQPVQVDFNVFYNNLSPYGKWIDYPRYGRVWAYNEPGFRPYYTRGHWDYTQYGWTWVSDYDWGWAPFHYGRWELDPIYGWIWIPGYDWAPAWVSWSESDGYYGWAPLGFGIDSRIGIGNIPRDRWVFVPQQYINNRRFYDYCAPFNRNEYFIRNGRMINNVYDGRNVRFMMGPDRYQVERVTHTRIQPGRMDNFGRTNNSTMDRQRNESYQQNERIYNEKGMEQNRGWSDRRNNNLPNRNEVYSPNARVEEQRNTPNWPNNSQRNNPITNNNNLPTERQREARREVLGENNNSGAMQRPERPYSNNNPSGGYDRQRSYNNERQYSGNQSERGNGSNYGGRGRRHE